MGTTLTQAFETALTQIKTDAVALLGDVIPPALTIAGIPIAIGIALRVFKKIAA